MKRVAVIAGAVIVVLLVLANTEAGQLLLGRWRGSAHLMIIERDEFVLRRFTFSLDSTRGDV